MSSDAKPAPGTPGQIFWLFGLSGAGKSTLAAALIDDLRTRGIAVLALDGDALRAGLCRGLGFSDSDRAENLRRAAEAAKLGAASGLCVVASFITPLEAHRRLVADILGAENLSFIHVSAPLEVCRSRDTKGLYARAQAGQVAQMTGLSSAFEAPRRADLVIATAHEGIAASAAQLLRFARTRLAPPRG
ncbi:MAG: adenylyl-sulfate kinase [Lacunisphaera sp.]|nr:adenylyl-sulfate kinase [Lacunisphaera sp.]